MSKACWLGFLISVGATLKSPDHRSTSSDSSMDLKGRGFCQFWLPLESPSWYLKLGYMLYTKIDSTLGSWSLTVVTMRWKKISQEESAQSRSLISKCGRLVFYKKFYLIIVWVWESSIVFLSLRCSYICNEENKMLYNLQALLMLRHL